MAAQSSEVGEEMKTVTVDAAALRRVLIALNGPPHYVRELQATMGLPGSNNPINILTDAFNAAVAVMQPEEANSAEPVAWMMETTHKTSGEKSVWISTDRKGWSNMESVTYGPQVPLYLHPPTDKKDEALRMAEKALDDKQWAIDGNVFDHAQRVQEALAAIVQQQKEALESVEYLIADSTGVIGLHMNGDSSPWSELRTGGRFDTWLFKFDEALALDVSQAEAILAKRDGEVLRRAATEFEARAHVVVPQELRRIADDLEKQHAPLSSP